jgi:hypothetical protein
MNHKLIKNEKGSWRVYLFDRWIRIFCRESDAGVRAGETLGVGSLILIPLEDFLMAFLAFF